MGFAITLLEDIFAPVITLATLAIIVKLMSMNVRLTNLAKITAIVIIRLVLLLVTAMVQVIKEIIVKLILTNVNIISLVMAVLVPINLEPFNVIVMELAS